MSRAPMSNYFYEVCLFFYSVSAKAHRIAEESTFKRQKKEASQELPESNPVIAFSTATAWIWPPWISMRYSTIYPWTHLVCHSHADHLGFFFLVTLLFFLFSIQIMYQNNFLILFFLIFLLLLFSFIRNGALWIINLFWCERPTKDSNCNFNVFHISHRFHSKQADEILLFVNGPNIIIGALIHWLSLISPNTGGNYAERIHCFEFDY